MLNFLHTFQPEPILFNLGPLAIHWYGLLMVVGGLIGFYLVLKLVVKYGLEKNFFYDLLFYWVIGAVLGARVYYIVYAWEVYKDNWIDIFKIWQGGLAIHGIMLGGFITTAIFCRIRKKDFWLIADLAVVGLAAGQVIGRLGNYFNQEIFGRPTDLPWGIPIDVVHRPDNYLDFNYFHPTFLYESMGNLLILFLLLFFHYYRLKKNSYSAGNIFLAYLIFYSVQRVLLEFLRVDYSPFVFGVRWAQLLSGAIFFLCLLLLIFRWFNNKRKKS